jgi:redox-sensitive bicupin YhaK (pirin superfamily)
MKFRGIQSTAPLIYQTHGNGFSDYNLRDQLGVSLDPFLNLDDFHMSQPTFKPHPHAGFSAVTYMFEDSAGAFINRDSLGDRSPITPGDLHWTQAGSGMLHEEVPETAGVDCHGLQMFVNLSEANELASPRAFHLNAADVPEVKGDGSRIRVLCGESRGLVSPLSDLLTPITLLDMHLNTKALVTHDLAPDQIALALMIQGEVQTGTPDEPVTVAGHQAIAFDQDGDCVQFTAGSAGAHLLLAAGVPTGKSNVWAGPFCLSSQAKAEDAIRRYRSGAMGTLSPSF